MQSNSIYMKKITEEIYLELKALVEEYGHLIQLPDEPPYFTVVRIEYDKKYNPNYGDDRVCKCGHSYYRHFDTYEGMEAVGCKYCECFEFEEATPEQQELLKNVGKYVQRIGNHNGGTTRVRPFKSTFKINTIKGVIEHPITKRWAYTFYEDDSYVECRMCKIVPDKIFR